MARGWESKSVEEQQSIASLPTVGNRSAEDHELITKRRDLELQISMIEGQLAAAKNERHREMLNRAHVELKQRLEKL